MDVRRLINVKSAALLIWVTLLLSVIALIGPGNIITSYEHMTPEGIRNFVLSFGTLAVIAFIIICAARPFFFLPITPFTIASGFLFGLAWGLTYAMVGSILSALLVFGISRYLFQDYVKTKVLNRYPAVDDLIHKKGWQFVAFLRLVPVLPFDVVGYLAGASRISIRDYLLGSVIGELPGALVLVIFGSTLAEPGSNIFYVSLLLVLCLLAVPEIARRILRRKSH